MNTRLLLVVIGILFHLCYLWSIFDIYFLSPLVHGMAQYPSTAQPPAKRLFLIVGDGLRADTTFSKINYNGTDQYLAPFLRSLVLNNGTYGVSHTRMPTESRPGHVAMIAGFYEDVSAVTKGWKENPVNFDSVLNQTYHTFSFGSPDILPMFSTGALDQNRIDTWMYGHEFEDFTKLSIELDNFVFQHMDQLFANASTNKTLDNLMRSDKVVFFLHLLGCDTAGHSHRPYSREYYENVRYIDAQIEQLIAKVNRFYGDDDTSYIFTADHGMSALGSHGDGHPNNTRTPLIAFGKGINGPKANETKLPYEEGVEDWHLEHVNRHDVKQADIASLMSYLVGLNYPSNSVGELPLEYLDTDELSKLKALYSNALGIKEQYLVKMQEVSANQFNFKAYPGFEKPLGEYLAQIELIISENGDTELGIQLSKQLIELSLDGLNYLQTYNWQQLKTIVTLGFLGWILYSFMIFLKLFVVTQTTNTTISQTNLGVFSAIALLIFSIFYGQSSPLNYYIYTVFPVFFWHQIIENYSVFISGMPIFFNNTSKGSLIAILISIVSIFEGITYGFFNRKIFTLLFVLLGFYRAALQVKGPYGFLWPVNCFVISLFTWSNDIKTESLFEINLGVAILLVVVLTGYFKIMSQFNSTIKTLVIVQIVLILVSSVSTNVSIVSLQSRRGLPLLAQITNWSTIILSLIVVPVFHFIHSNPDLNLRLFIIFLTFSPIFIILTISFELLFYISYSLLILQWINLEAQYKHAKKAEHADWLQCLRISVIGFFLCQIAFFGTGNVASISSFSLESVYRLIPIFDPFPMGALLMIKLIIPYVLLSAGLGILNINLHIQTFTISTLIISISDLLSLNFFFLVKTEGSWLDIGITISNYCIAILSSLFIILLEYFSHIILGGVKVEKQKTH